MCVPVHKAWAPGATQRLSAAEASWQVGAWQGTPPTRVAAGFACTVSLQQPKRNDTENGAATAARVRLCARGAVSRDPLRRGVCCVRRAACSGAAGGGTWVCDGSSPGSSPHGERAMLPRLPRRVRRGRTGVGLETGRAPEEKASAGAGALRLVNYTSISSMSVKAHYQPLEAG